jgi:hypothetical protein
MGRWQGTTKERGLGSDHVADKNRLLALHRDGDPCWRCGQPMYKSQALDRDHVIDRALGGKDGPAVLAHASCNRAAGARASNQRRQFTLLAATTAGANVTCRVCGKHYTRAARACEMCGVHYHPSYGQQRTCSRSCGVELKRRTGSIGGPRKPRPRCATCGKPCNLGCVYCSKTCAGDASKDKNQTWPSSRLQHYTCRYCGQQCVAKATTQPREVCPAPLCQAQRLNDNRMRHDGVRRPDWFGTSRAW